MIKLKTLVLMVAAMVPCAAFALSPADGRVAGKSYVNSYFHLTYTWPAMLTPVKLPPPPPEGKSTYEYMLFSAQQGKQPYGVVMVAHKLGVAGPHSAGLKSSGEMIDRLARSLRPGPVLANISRTQKKNARGEVFDILNYTMSGKPSAVMATQSGQYVIVLKCSAQSANDMAQMQKSALEMRVAK